MYLQKNINIIMNVETDLLGSVLVNHAEDFFFLHEYTVLSHASIANFPNLDLMCFFEKFRLF